MAVGVRAGCSVRTGVGPAGALVAVTTVVAGSWAEHARAMRRRSTTVAAAGFKESFICRSPAEDVQARQVLVTS